MKKVPNKEMRILEIPKWGRYLRERWRELFAGHLTYEEIKEIGMDYILWHLCSWERVECLEKEAAIEAFHKQAKHKLTVFYQFVDEAYLFEHARSLKVTDLPYVEAHMNYSDMYVLDWDNGWSFILTHESEIGPFFIKRY